MKRKLLTVFLSLIAALCLCFGLVACDSGNSDSGNHNTENNVETDLWTVERLYAEAQAKGFEGSLDDLIALFKGEKGDDGQDGIGVKSVNIDENGHLKVTLTNDTVLDAGKVTADGTADEGTEGLQYQKVKGEDGEYTLAVVGLGTAWDTDIVIPSTYRGLKVTAIGNRAFDATMDARNANLTSVEIPGSVTSIGDRTFAYCSELESVTIGSGVTTFGEAVFSGCYRLTSVTIPDSVTSIGGSAFYDCNQLTGVYITNLSAWCRIDFGGYYANPLSCAHHLYVDNVELKELTIPDEITKIKPYTFTGCSGLERVTIGSGVTSIGQSAFSGCSSLASIVIPDGVTEIGTYAFNGCGLQNVTIGSGVTEIGYGAFSGCSSLASITIPDSVTSIERAAFEYCSGLQSVTIGSGVTSIGEEVFYQCSGLMSITIPDSVTEIGMYAFYGCSGLTSIDIPDSVTTIGNSAFLGCSGLTSVIWNAENCTTAGSSSYPIFKECTSLKTVTFGENVKTIPAYAFYGCDNLQNVIFADPNNWYYHNTLMQGLSNPAAAAQLLRQNTSAWEKRG